MDRTSPRAGRVRTSTRPSAIELADVAVAQGALLAALLRARFRPTGLLVAPAPGAGGGGAPADRAARGERQAVVKRATRAIDRASRRGLFRPTCLVRSLALTWLLERWGVDGARIRIGVRPRAVRAHAWVELDGRVIGDDPRHVATFAPLGSVTSVPLRWR